MFDPKIVMDNLPVIGGFLITIGLFYKAWSETRRLNKEAELKNKREELELSQLAAKFNIETVAGATTSAVSVLTNIADRLKSQLDESDAQITALKHSRAERDEEIAKMKEQQAETNAKMGGLVEANKKLVEANETLVQENNQLRQENAQLKTDNAAIKQDNATIKAQLRTMIRELQKAQLPLPDGVEHEGNGESGGGTG